MARIRLENLNKQFGEHKALIDFSLDVADGEFFVLLGPTGAGKTTTLRLIAGLDKPTSGKVYINEADVADWGPAERDTAPALPAASCAILALTATVPAKVSMAAAVSSIVAA